MVRATLLCDNGGGAVAEVGAAEPGEARWRERQLRHLRSRAQDRTVRQESIEGAPINRKNSRECTHAIKAFTRSSSSKQKSELTAELKRHGLPRSGGKASLIDRLVK